MSVCSHYLVCWTVASCEEANECTARRLVDSALLKRARSCYEAIISDHSAWRVAGRCCAKEAAICVSAWRSDASTSCWCRGHSFHRYGASTLMAVHSTISGSALHCLWQCTPLSALGALHCLCQCTPLSAFSVHSAHCCPRCCLRILFPMLSKLTSS